MRKLLATIAAVVAGAAGFAVATQAVAASETSADAGWAVLLLPYIEQDNVYRAFDQATLGNNTGSQGRNFGE